MAWDELKNEKNVGMQGTVDKMRGRGGGRGEQREQKRADVSMATRGAAYSEFHCAL